MEGTTMAQVAIFKQIFDKVRNNLNYHWFYSELKRHNVSHYIYYLATENIHLVLENDNTVLIKGQSKVVNVRFSKNKCLIEATLKDSNQESYHFTNTGKILLQQGFSDGLQISTKTKGITIPLIIHYSLLRTFRTLHKYFRTKS